MIAISSYVAHKHAATENFWKNFCTSLNPGNALNSWIHAHGGYKTETETPKMKTGPFKIILKLLEIGSNMILDWIRTRRKRFAVFIAFSQGFCFVQTPPKVQNEDPFEIVSKSLQNGLKPLKHQFSHKYIITRSNNLLQFLINLARVFV